MKRLLFSLALVGTTFAQASETYVAATNAWFSGNASNVLVLAEARLATNANDIAGILLKASWAFDFADTPVLTNSLQRILDVGPSVRTETFSKVFRLTRLDVAGSLNTLSRQTPEERAEDIRKMRKVPHLMAYQLELMALERDGYMD